MAQERALRRAQPYTAKAAKRAQRRSRRATRHTTTCSARARNPPQALVLQKTPRISRFFRVSGAFSRSMGLRVKVTDAQIKVIQFRVLKLQVHAKVAQSVRGSKLHDALLSLSQTGKLHNSTKTRLRLEPFHGNTRLSFVAGH
jgi:hypothetical protein